jgi:peptidoglycan/LPS O-acetylase OafA/YrhL
MNRFRDPGLATGSGRVLELDGIRGIAILLVISCHYRAFASSFDGLTSIGWIGVDVFFVLSGFLITTILLELRDTSSPFKYFYVRRFLRILPVYYVALAVISVVSAISHEHMLHLGYFVNRIFFLQSLLDSPALLRRSYSVLIGLLPLPALFHKSILPIADQGASLGSWANSLGAAWSLSIEEYFYFLWAPVVLLVRRQSHVLTIATLLFLVSIGLRYVGFSDAHVYFDFLARMDVLMVGAYLAIFLQWRRAASSKHGEFADMVMKCIIAISAMGFVLSLWCERPFLGRELRDSASFLVFGLTLLNLFIGASLCLIILNKGDTNLLCRFFRLRGLRYLGTISYSVYLFHIPVYYAVMRMAAKYTAKTRGTDMCASTFSLILVIILAALSWKFFEQPILALKDKFAPAQPKRSMIDSYSTRS